MSSSGSVFGVREREGLRNNKAGTKLSGSRPHEVTQNTRSCTGVMENETQAARAFPFEVLAVFLVSLWHKGKEAASDLTVGCCPGFTAAQTFHPGVQGPSPHVLR